MRFTNANSYSDGTFSDSDLYGYGYGYGSFRNSDAYSYSYSYGYGTFSDSDLYGCGYGNANCNRDAHAAAYPNAEAGSDTIRAYGRVLFK